MANKSKIIEGIQYKQCSKCKQFKPLEGFYKLKRGAFGVKGECKKCGHQRIYNWRKATGYQRKRYRNDPEFREQIKQRSREWSRAHPSYQKEWVKANPDYQREWQRRFRLEHPDYYRKLQEMRQKT